MPDKSEAEIATLTDAELLKIVAVKILGYMESECSLHVLGVGKVAMLLECSHSGRETVWSPLTDWNATMQVIETMRKKGWRFQMSDHFSKGYIAIFMNGDGLHYWECPHGDERRAILMAALRAVDAEKGEGT